MLRVGNFRTSYSVKLDQSFNSNDAHIATVTFRNSEQKDSHVCGDITPVLYKRLIIDLQPNGMVFDGIFLERIELTRLRWTVRARLLFSLSSASDTHWPFV